MARALRIRRAAVAGISVNGASRVEGEAEAGALDGDIAGSWALGEFTQQRCDGGGARRIAGSRGTGGKHCVYLIGWHYRSEQEFFVGHGAGESLAHVG